MKAWRVHDFGEPADTFVLDNIDGPTSDDLAGMGMGLAGWVPAAEGQEPFDDWVLLEMRTAALAVGMSTIFHLPAGMSEEEGADFLIPSHTAIRRGRVNAADTVAVLGAAGGLGSAIVQLCQAQGARVIAVVGGSEKVAFCARLGVEAVDHVADDFVAALHDRTGGRGVDAILDPVQVRWVRGLGVRSCPMGRVVVRIAS